MENKTDRLKLCPFCGSKENEIRIIDIPDKEGTPMQRTCSHCGASSGFAYNKVDADKNWNTRPQEPSGEVVAEYKERLFEKNGMIIANELDPKAHFKRIDKKPNLDEILREFKKMILIQIEDTENFPTPEVWTDNLLIALKSILEKS